MNDLLTPEQLRSITRRDRFDTDKNNPAKRDRRALLRDREAIAGRLGGMLASWIEPAKPTDEAEKLREMFVGDIRDLLTAIRGAKV